MAPAPFQRRLDELRPQRARLNIDGAATEIWQYSPTAKSNSNTVVLAIHGFRGDHHGLEPFVAFMKDATWFIPDLPGFGVSPAFTEAHTIERYVRWLELLTEHVRMSVGPDAKLVLLGHSFGSIPVAAASAKTVDAVVLVNPITSPALQGPRGIATRFAVLYYRIAELLPERMGRKLLSSRLIVRIMGNIMAKNPDRVVRRFVHAQHFAYFSTFASRQSLLQTFRVSVSHTVADERANLEKLNKPVLLIAGDLDDLAPAAVQRELAQSITRASLHVIPNVGHLVHYEAPAVAMSVMNRWLTEQVA